MTEANIPTDPGTTFSFDTTNSIVMKSESTVTSASYMDASDTLFGTATELSHGSVTGTTTSLGNYTIGPFSGDFEIDTAEFSMTKTFTFTPVSTSISPSINGQFEVDMVVPEPLSISLLGSGLAMLGLVTWRRGAPRSAEAGGPDRQACELQ